MFVAPRRLMRLSSVAPVMGNLLPWTRGYGWIRGLGLMLFLTLGQTVTAGTWTPVAATAPGSVSQFLLLTDGTVMAQDGGGNGWFKLTPDIHGSYVNGTWSTLAPMHVRKEARASAEKIVFQPWWRSSGGRCAARTNRFAR